MLNQEQIKTNQKNSLNYKIEKYKRIKDWKNMNYVNCFLCIFVMKIMIYEIRQININLIHPQLRI